MFNKTNLWEVTLTDKVNSPIHVAADTIEQGLERAQRWAKELFGSNVQVLSIEPGYNSSHGLLVELPIADRPLAEPVPFKIDPVPYDIFVNAAKVSIAGDKKSATYNELVTMAGLKGEPTVVFWGGLGSATEKEQGTVVPGQTIPLTPGLKISVAHTDAA